MLLMLILPRLMKSMDPESQKVQSCTVDPDLFRLVNVLLDFYLMDLEWVF